jgi:hypothetical protein
MEAYIDGKETREDTLHLLDPIPAVFIVDSRDWIHSAEVGSLDTAIPDVEHSDLSLGHDISAGASGHGHGLLKEY